MMPPLTEFILRLVDVFDRLHIPYALGGAVATSYWGTTRTTEDADCLVNVPAIAFQQFADELNSLSCVMDEPTKNSPITVAGLQSQIAARRYMTIERRSIQAEMFIPTVPLQDEILRRAVEKPLGDRTIKVTTAEDLILLKLAFHRHKDIGDVRSILYLQRGKLDLDYLYEWSPRVHDDATVAELEQLINEFAD